MFLKSLLTGITLLLLFSATCSAQQTNPETLTETQSSTSAQPATSPTPRPTVIQPVNLSVSPISLNIATKPGSPTTSSIRIRNNATGAEFLRLRLATFTANEAGDAPVIRDFESTDPEKDWLTLSETEFTVQPGEWKTVQLTFSPPDSAALGYYYAILVERQQQAEVEPGASVVSGVPAILVLTEVASPLAKRQLELVAFTASRKLYEYLPVEFDITIKNTGNIQALPVGDIFIDGNSTNDIGILQINPAKGMILPGTERTYKVSWDDGFPRFINEKDEYGNEKKHLEWDFSRANKLRIGKFSATALFVYDDGQRDVPTEATVSFWVVPWKILAGLTVAVLLVLTGIALPAIMIMKRLKKTNNKKSSQK